MGITGMQYGIKFILVSGKRTPEKRIIRFIPAFYYRTEVYTKYRTENYFFRYPRKSGSWTEAYWLRE